MSDESVRVYRKDHEGWWDTVPAATAVMVQHLHLEHNMSVRQINRRLSLTDHQVRTCLGEDQT